MDRFLQIGFGDADEPTHQLKDVDVDRISFTSLYPEDLLDGSQESDETHQDSSLTASSSELFFDATSHNDEIPQPKHSTPAPPKDYDGPMCFPLNADLPFWRGLQMDLFSLRLDNENNEDDKLQNTDNRMIYTAQLAMAMVEEASWRAEIASDPELAEELAKFDSYLRPSFIRSANSTLDEYFDAADADHTQSTVTENGTFYVDPRKRSVTSVRSSVEGVDEVILKKNPDLTAEDVAVRIISAIPKRFPLIDGHVSKWINDVITGQEKLLKGHPVGQQCPDDAIHKPLRDEWIFKLHPPKTVRDLLKEQDNRCAGCHVSVPAEYAKRVRYCEYFGLVFCQCCHQGSKAAIPARILHLWNFKELPVSDRALAFLQQTKDQPAIHIRSLAPQLINKIRVLRTTILLREKLFHMWSYVQMCSLAEETVTKYGNLRTMFTSLEKHMLADSDVFSLSDLERVYNGDLPSHLEPIVQFGKYHIENCETCRAQAFNCAICGSDTDLLFPFQTERIVRCEGCGSLSHARCDAKRNKVNDACKKCTRMEIARQRRKVVSVHDD